MEKPLLSLLLSSSAVMGILKSAMLINSVLLVRIVGQVDELTQLLIRSILMQGLE